MAVPALVGAYWEDRAARAFALVTIEPNEFVRAFHDRMIAQLPDPAIDVWLRPEASSKEKLFALLKPPPNDELVAFPLKADAGKARFDDAEALKAVGPALSWNELKGR